MSAFIAFDTETEAFGPGNMAPRPVIASFYDGASGFFERFKNLFTDEDASLACEALLRPGVVVATANGSYDMAVIARDRPELLKLIFDKHERGEWFDIQIQAALDAIAEGRMTEGMVLDRNGQVLRKEYPDGPASNRFSLAACVYLYLGRMNAKQNAAFRTMYGALNKLPREQWPAEAQAYPIDDAKNTYEVAAVMRGLTGTPAQNLGQIGAQFIEGGAPPLIAMTHHQLHTYAAFCMHLGSVWGFRTERSRIDAIMANVNKGYEAEVAFFRTEGLYKVAGVNGVKPKDDGKENRARIKREVILAYGGDASVPCAVCAGTGKVPSPKTKNKINCAECGATGLDVPPTVPRTPTEGISTERDTLAGADNPMLDRWVKHDSGAKMRETYSPWLYKGCDVSINDRPNPVIASCRASYDGLVQLIPPIARECIRSREGYYFFSNDYSSGELCTLAQAAYWAVGKSRMRDVINATKDPGALHTEFAAKMAGVDTADSAALKAFKLAAKLKGSRENRLRQMAKAANFGFPGMMGPAKFVLAKRKEGLRLCVVSGLNPVCAKPVMTWRGRQLDKPTCPDCLEVAAKLREDWLAAWPEIPEYFDWVLSHDGMNDGHGVMVTPGTGMVRGGLTAMSGANNTFQHLLAIAAKLALTRVSYEAYCKPESVLWGTRPIIFVHDELWGETPKATAHLAGPRISEIMVAAGKQVCPDIGGWEVQPTLSEYWYKKAEPTYDAEGRLVCWQPRDEAGAIIPWSAEH